MANQHQKEPPLSPTTKVLVKDFEEGNYVVAQSRLTSEAIISRPGGTQKMVKAYESKTTNGISKAESIVRRKKNVLVLFAHPEHKSFNGALLDLTVKTLEEQGHLVTVSDLYKMNFNPVVSSADVANYKEIAEQREFNYLKEMKLAWQTGTLSADIMEEHRKLTAADLLIFQFPMQWYGFPAILKGWYDRVITYGYAHDLGLGAAYDQGKMKDKKAILSITTGGPETMYSTKGLHGDINTFLYPLHALIRFPGFQVLKSQLHFGVKLVSDEKRQEYLTAWQRRLQDNVFSEQPLDYLPLASFDPSKGFALKEGTIDTDSPNWPLRNQFY